MSDSIMIKNNIKMKNKSFNWPVVGFLLFMTGIPGIPAFFILAVVALGADVGESFSSVVNVLYFETPAAIFVHGGAGILFFLTMPFQFSPALRNKKSNWHKTGGRIALLSGYVMAVSGVWMHHVLSPDSFGMRYVSLVILSIAMCTAFSLALWHIINRNFDVHRKWMIRAVAITLAVITLLFVEAILFLLFGQLENTFAVISQFQHDYGRLVGITINLIIVEYIFFTERSKQKSQYPLAMLAEK
ncbi:DUF2306 domain-containing protein [Colwellia piezophila]|uniref:DUF2306 domain-containing protein n=1 Tax=Colwellia piezophila TaxID=211668 RepID=UPI0003643460|nr:DUF2306 domain-containing protein [Colwellia piezophila]